jgi:prepilin-type N-terminal cleavage/methylation domain-containing protein
MRLKATNRGRAFTLVELLVVIAIIAILAALLMPVLSKTKNSASKATDLNNLKQIMVAVHLYASDNGDGFCHHQIGIMAVGMATAPMPAGFTKRTSL